jgi:DEAD/DEAH box helicase domain-containing protein
MNKIDHIVVDVEIQKTIEELPRGWDDTQLMGVAVAVVYEYLTDRFRIYGENDVQALQQRLLKADRISGFNIEDFDYKVIFPCTRKSTLPEIDSLIPKTNDALQKVWNALGGRFYKGWKLDDIMKGTFGIGKIGNGADAPKWYKEGKLLQVTNYCLDDVSLERDLTDFIDKHGFVISQVNGYLKL